MSVDSVRRPSRSQEEEEEAPASPAVPRPRLKIRVLTSVDQIIVRTNYERDALELLKKQSYGHAKRFDTEFLMMTGLRQDMNRVFTAAGWSHFADITELENGHVQISHRHILTGHPHCAVCRCSGECTSHISARDG